MNENNNQLNKRIRELEAEITKLKSKNDRVGFGFGFLFNEIKQPAFILDANISAELPVITRANKSALELLKYTFEECKKFTPVELGIFNSVDQYKKFVNPLSSNESITYLGKIVANNGQTISSEITVYPFFEGENVQLLIFQRNIGNQQKVVEALRQSEYRFLQMAENIAEGIVIVEEGKAVFINSSMTQITGYNKEQLRDMDEYSMAREDEIERIKAFKQKTNDAPQGIHGIEYWIKTRMGQEKCVRSNYTFAQRTDGRKSTYIITSEITAQKRIEQALRKSQTDFRMLAENSPDVITRYNKDLTYSYANLTVESLIGIPISQFIGRNNLELDLEAELVSFLEEMHLEVFRTGRKLKFEYRVPIKNETRIFQAHLVPELSQDGTVESVLNVSRDITQIKQVERSLKEEKQNVIEENLLIAENLTFWCNRLCDTSADGQVGNPKACLDPILSIAEWAQYGHNQENITPKNLVVNTLIKDFFNRNAGLIEAEKLEANILLPVHEITIYSDERLLNMTLMHLLENAIEATHEGKIEIGYDIYNDKEIVFFIKDTGIGINPDDTEKIFKPFVSMNKENHAGLGLSIAEKNVEALSGIIWCLSAPGTGSTFCFTHPAQIEKSLLQSKNEKRGPAWNNKKVLVVEDTDTNYLLIEGLLSLHGVKLTRAIDGDQGITLVKENPDFDLILMDIQLPGINGFEATKEIRKFNANIPIIAQTAYAMYDDVVKALDAGCNDFIAKPIKTKKFIGMVDKYLSK